MSATLEVIQHQLVSILSRMACMKDNWGREADRNPIKSSDNDVDVLLPSTHVTFA